MVMPVTPGLRGRNGSIMRSRPDMGSIGKAQPEPQSEKRAGLGV